MEEKQTYPDFLKGEGKVNSFICSIDWTAHPLGPPEKWPASLRITLNTILHSDQPMLLFWGPEYFCFYNDAFLLSLDSRNKYIAAIGKKAEEVWPKNRDSLLASIADVVHKESAITYEDYLLPVFYNQISLSPVKDETGCHAGVLAICTETASSFLAEQELKELNEENKRILENITVGFFSINENWIITHWNREAEQLLEKKQDHVRGENFWDMFSEWKKLKLHGKFKAVMNKRTPASLEEYYEPLGKWFSFNVYPSKQGISVYFKDITSQRRLQLINERTEEISGVAGWELDLSTQKVFMTPKVYEIYGLPKDSVIDLEVNKKLYDEKSLQKIDKALKYAIQEQKPYEIELNLTGNAEDKIIRINGYPLQKEGKVTKIYGTLEDVTQEKKEKKKLEETVQKLKTAQKIGKMGYWTLDFSEGKSEWSDEMYNILEVEPDTYVPSLENLLETIHPDDQGFFLKDINTAFPDKNYHEIEHRIITPKGQTKWLRARITLHRDEKGPPKLLEGISHDITDKKKHEEQILQTLQEKETLLEEVHHRVKNNLAVISSMVQLQAYEETNSEVKNKLMDGVARIMSMASIHEQLYQSHSFSKLNLSESLKKLITKVVETLDYNIPVSLNFKLDPVEMNINQAIPCSLITNEVVTNVIKHAFIGKPKGKIEVVLTEENNQVNLLIRDNGVGMPQDFDAKQGKTLGLRLINTLANQLNADYIYKSENGTVFSLKFEKLKVKGSGSTNIK